jgi:hypothetical protein
VREIEELATVIVVLARVITVLPGIVMLAGSLVVLAGRLLLELATGGAAMLDSSNRNAKIDENNQINFPVPLRIYTLK